MLRSRNDYLGETMFLLTIIHSTEIRNELYKIYHNIQNKSIYTTEIIKINKIRKALEKEQEMLWDE